MTADLTFHSRTSTACVCHTQLRNPHYLFVTDKSAQMGAVCWPQLQAKVIEQTEGLRICARVQTV